MLMFQYSGWASCRLATDPDPFDDPRGNLSSFRQLAYAGEPDLDRTIWFNNPPFVRPHCDLVGVAVRTVSRDGRAVADHPLVDAAVDLLDRPALEGRNHVVAWDQAEPIYPFHLRLGGAGGVARAKTPKDLAYPFEEYAPVSGGVDPNEVFTAIGRQSHQDAWTNRLALLRSEHATGDETIRPGLEERIAMLESELARPNGLHSTIIAGSMRWRNALDGSTSGDVADLFGPNADSERPWIADLWFGGFDADAQSFFCKGTLAVPEAGDTSVFARFDRRAQR